MLLAEEVTSHPGEQKIIEDLDEGLRPFYRDDLPHHNYEHAHDEVLPEVLRLDELQPTDTRHGRFNLIAAALGHDAAVHLPVDPERQETREERATRLIRPVLIEAGYLASDIAEINGMVLATGLGTICETPGQIKLRRADISNVGGKRLPFLATTVNIFHEKAMLANEQDGEAPAWRTYVPAQQRILTELLAQDLSLGNERISRGMGPFNRAALKNVSWMSKKVVRDPASFHHKYDQYLKPLVSGVALAAIA